MSPPPPAIPPPGGRGGHTWGKAAASATVGSTRTELNGLWTAQVLPFCRQATENRYPVYRQGSSDVLLADFARLFGPNGLIDTFFNQNLRPYVDMTRLPWRWQKVEGVDLGIAPAALAQFQRAAAIRESFFAAGVGPQVTFDLVQTTLPAGVSQAVLEVDGQTVTFVPGQSRPMPLHWPGAAGQTRVTFNGAPSPDLVVDGPWSWFRLLDRSRVGSAGGDRLAVMVTAGGQSVGFELRANSVRNPFSLKELSEFRCPGGL